MNFMIVIPEGKEFQVGLADGIYPWKHLATSKKRTDANRIATLLAMHYRVKCYPADALRHGDGRPKEKP